MDVGAKTHRFVELGLCHALAVVDDHDALNASRSLDHANGNATGASVDRVVDEIRNRLGEAVPDRAQGKNELARDRIETPFNCGHASSPPSYGSGLGEASRAGLVWQHQAPLVP